MRVENDVGRETALLVRVDKEGISDNVKFEKRPEEIKESLSCSYLREERI